MSILKDQLKDPEYCKQVIDLLKQEINDSNAWCTIEDVADAVSEIKIRDAMLCVFNQEAHTLTNFINWWAGNQRTLQWNLNEEQKVHMLVLMSGALLLANLPDSAEEAVKVCMGYAQAANMSTPSLALLLQNSINSSKLMGKPEDAHKIWKDSLSNVNLEEILNK